MARSKEFAGAGSGGDAVTDMKRAERTYHSPDTSLPDDDPSRVRRRFNPYINKKGHSISGPTQERGVSIEEIPDPGLTPEEELLLKEAQSDHGALEEIESMLLRELDFKEELESKKGQRGPSSLKPEKTLSPQELKARDRELWKKTEEIKRETREKLAGKEKQQTGEVKIRGKSVLVEELGSLKGSQKTLAERLKIQEKRNEARKQWVKEIIARGPKEVEKFLGVIRRLMETPKETLQREEETLQREMEEWRKKKAGIQGVEAASLEIEAWKKEREQGDALDPEVAKWKKRKEEEERLQREKLGIKAA